DIHIHTVLYIPPSSWGVRYTHTHCIIYTSFILGGEIYTHTHCIIYTSFILGVCLRIQINQQNKGDFQGISPERAFADFLFANTILHLVVINFVG
ncbi:hypothetical protein FKM82_023121, partial [Ascaphus truei]